MRRKYTLASLRNRLLALTPCVFLYQTGMSFLQLAAPLDTVQNLSAPFIMQVPPFKKTLMDSIPYMDFLFGNEVRVGIMPSLGVLRRRSCCAIVLAKDSCNI